MTSPHVRRAVFSGDGGVVAITALVIANSIRVHGFLVSLKLCFVTENRAAIAAG